MPNDIPLNFKVGSLLTSDALNDLQRAILRALAEHDHTGGINAAPIATGGIADRAVTDPKIADLAVTLRALADAAVDARVLADAAVTAPKIASDAVTTDAIADGNVTQAKLSDEVQALLLRTGGGASSASQVIWRDPIYTFPNREIGSIVDGIINPGKWEWEIETVSVDEDDKPIKFRPNTDPTKVVSVIEREKTPPEEYDLITKYLESAAVDAAVGVFAVGAAGYSKDAFEFAVKGAGERTPEEWLIAADKEGRELAGQPMMMAMVAEEAGALASRTAATASAPSAGVRAAAETPPKTSAPTRSAEAAIKRSLTLGSVDADGKPVPRDAQDAIVVNAGFFGKEEFAPDGEAINFRDLAGASASRQNAAAEAIGKTMFNLGIDREYLVEIGATDPIKEFFELAYGGSRGFFDPSNPLWGNVSWLPEILERPHLFGTGYSLSGGRNIRSVTRQYAKGNTADSWVRVRFITPYRNAAYAVNVTPRAKSVYGAITANIRAKTVDYVDINFVGLRKLESKEIIFRDVSNLSFDLAVYGELGVAS